mmetsp:Transcript_15146/g.12883  ORF Transcript_15146/g.12883 Transcript_15146/m.12883 type:complete len:162 (+) Transcript_15146:2463-2948(+)
MGAEFKEYFKKIHWEIYPISEEELKQFATANKINKNQLFHSKETGLVRNACLARDCPYFLKPVGRLSHHMDVWESELPLAFHKTVRLNRHKSVDEIFELFSHGSEQKVLKHQEAIPKKNFEYYFDKEKKMDGYDEEKYGRKVSEVQSYIQKLKEAYIKILG